MIKFMAELHYQDGGDWVFYKWYEWPSLPGTDDFFCICEENEIEASVVRRFHKPHHSPPYIMVYMEITSEHDFQVIRNDPSWRSLGPGEEILFD